MSSPPESAVPASHLAKSSLPQGNGHSAFPSNDPEDPQTCPTKRSEVLRHVFPLPLRSRTSQSRKVVPPVTKRDDHKNVVPPTTQSRPRVALHRYITSLFGNNQDHGDEASRPQARSRTSSFGSKPDSSIYGSVPSLDVVLPGTFVFSGPSLRSTESHSNSTSYLPSLIETNSEPEPLRRTRTDSFSMLDDARAFSEGILEPVVEQGITRTLSDVLLGISTPTEEVESSLLEELGQDKTLPGSTCVQVNIVGKPTASISSGAAFRANRAVSTIAALLAPNLDTSVWKALRLTSRTWYEALRVVAPPIFPASYRIPTEILQHIYDYLGPKDFNAARHTCGIWMRASLTKTVLMTMLSRGGWLSSAEDVIHLMRHPTTHQPEKIPGSEEWSLSRHLARQCVLASGFTGNGLDARSAVVETSQIDFAKLANGHTASACRDRGGLVFATSVCSRFLCVARDTLIYIYDLQNGFLTPATSVVCPRRVLLMSMDVSSGRHAVAALLEGRMGMVCELRYGKEAGDESPVEFCVESNGIPYRTTTKTSIFTSHASEFENGLDFAERTSSQAGVHRSFLYQEEQDFESFTAIDVQSNYQDVSLRETDNERLYNRNLINQAWNLDLHGPPNGLTPEFSPSSIARSIPSESGTSTFYRHLCSEDDPPRCVSICPQRRCVAFGCSAGIELHWVDALTGQSLSRWFPLTAPSDYLYFLSPRPGIESAKKLRLISSAAHPNDRPAISRKLFGRPTISAFWGSFGFESGSRRPGSPKCDHYHAIPLSDGHHILFIDPSAGKLTLGCDAPLGGPTKLLRKVVLIPPEEKAVPRLYTAAADISQGARVVVAYGDIIMLYSVPPDVCRLSQLEQRAESWDVYTAPPFSKEGRTRDHWLNWWDEPSACDPGKPCDSDNSNPIWPIAIRGTEIGRLSGVCELAVQTRPDVLIWAFTHSLQCKTWRLQNHADPIIRLNRYICRSGLVHDSFPIDEVGDVIAPLPPPANASLDLHLGGDVAEMPKTEESVIVGFDGNTSGILKRTPRALAVENDNWVDFLDVMGCSEAWYEGDGDVVARYES